MENIENTSEVTTEEQAPKHVVTAQTKRWLEIMISDHWMTFSGYTPETLDQFYAKLGRLVAMMSGNIPFEGKPAYQTLPPLKEKVGAKEYLCFFFAKNEHLRHAKGALRQNLQLIHDAHGMHFSETTLRFSVNHLTETAALRCFENNRDIFTALTIVKSRGKNPEIVNFGTVEEDTQVSSEDVEEQAPEITSETSEIE